MPMLQGLQLPLGIGGFLLGFFAFRILPEPLLLSYMLLLVGFVLLLVVSIIIGAIKHTRKRRL